MFGLTRRCLAVFMIIVVAVISLAGCSEDSDKGEPKPTYSWKPMQSGVTDILYGVGGTSANNVYVGGENGRMLHWDGSGWSRMERAFTSRVNSLIALSETSIWVATSNDSIFHYNGTSWTRYKGGTNEWLYGIYAFSDTDVWAVGDNGWVTHFDGTWTADQVGVQGDDFFRAVWGSSPDNVLVGGFYARLLKYSSGMWTAIDPGNYDDNFTGIWGSSATNVYISTWGEVFHYDGANTITLDYDGPVRYYGIWGHSENDIFVAGNDGEVLHYNGTNWSVMNTGTDTDWRGIWGTSPTNVIVVGGGGTIYTYSED